VTGCSRGAVVALRWLADENFNNDILRALFRRNRTLDIVRAQDVGLSAVEDSSLLAWAAEATRILLTHDHCVCLRPREKWRNRMPGVFEVSREVPIRVRRAISSLVQRFEFRRCFSKD
jgi:uncharacterized protein with PIN domain